MGLRHLSSMAVHGVYTDILGEDNVIILNRDKCNSEKKNTVIGIDVQKNFLLDKCLSEMPAKVWHSVLGITKTSHVE